MCHSVCCNVVGNGGVKGQHNAPPPWAAYCILMASRLIFQDKCLGVRHVGVGEIWIQMMAKCVLKVAGQEAKKNFGTEKLCRGMEA